MLFVSFFPLEVDRRRTGLSILDLPSTQLREIISSLLITMVVCVGMENAKVRVLVTGGSGLVGRGMQEVLPEYDVAGQLWIFCSSKDVNLENKQETMNFFRRWKPNKVIHLAAKVGGLFANMDGNVEFFHSNMDMNANIVRCCHAFGVEKLVSCLSTCIFPDQAEYPISETELHSGPPHTSNIGYSYAKRMVDVMNHIYGAQYHCKFTSVIPCNVYGKYDNFNLDSSHVIPGLIHKCYLAMLEQTPLVVSGSGMPLRQFLYSKDLARLLIWTLEEYDEVEPIILSVDEDAETSIADLSKLISTSLGFKGGIVFDTLKSDGQMKKTASNKKLRSYMPEFVFTSLEEGLKETCKWFVEAFHEARK